MKIMKIISLLLHSLLLRVYEVQCSEKNALFKKMKLHNFNRIIFYCTCSLLLLTFLLVIN
jgi:hypothetical protein